MADEHYDAIVIGTSQGGRLLPVELAKAGQRVALDARRPRRWSPARAAWRRAGLT